ncbi:MAG: hypothetical protein GX663_09945 [Clostridiales bacterium]|nr:hypothetical protein [Clostridiales bacterium]
MKNIIVTLALLLVLIVYEIFQGDFNQMFRCQENVKDTADLAASAAMLSVEPRYYGDGWIVYDYDRATREISQLLKKNMVDSFDSGSNYSIYTYFFDYSGVSIGDRAVSEGIMHSFDDLEARAVRSFKWGDKASLCTDIKEKTGQDFTIDEPCVACFLHRGYADMRLSALKKLGKINKLSVYEYKRD